MADESAGRAYDLLIVGAGPTGLAAANLLGQAGRSALVVERDPGTATMPRAVSIDDESMRLLQAVDLLQEARKIALAGTGTQYFGAHGQLLTYARGPVRPPYGLPVKNPIDHPQFQRLLLDGARRFGDVSVSFETTLVGLEAGPDWITGQLREASGKVRTVRARYLLGCDGGQSVVRSLTATRMQGSSFTQRWLVIDTVNDAHDERYYMHHGDPRRPHVIAPGMDGRCRYEFLLAPGEDGPGATSLPFLRELIAPYRHSLRETDIVRSAVYTFNALVAERWRAGRSFLLGDAAHMMPPFAGQGLNSGLRDAGNLAWKLALCLRGEAGDALLDTYERERRPHAEAMVSLSLRIGRVVMTTSTRRARLRDLAFAAANRIAPARRFLGEIRFKPPAFYPGGLAVCASGDGPASRFCGRMLPQSEVMLPAGGQALLDELLGPGFALLAVDLDGPAVDGLRAGIWDRIGARRVSLRLADRRPGRCATAAVAADIDGRLGSALAAERGRILLVRPDRFVLGSFAPAREEAFAVALAAQFRLTGSTGRHSLPSV